MSLSPGAQQHGVLQRFLTPWSTYKNYCVRGRTGLTSSTRLSGMLTKQCRHAGSSGSPLLLSAKNPRDQPGYNRQPRVQPTALGSEGCGG
ncbi:MAG: hypothetical protein HOB45_04035 [Planctomycetaceae bacterium]|nr:hypothetical protein [Planctomycetaceae bacterium]